MADRRPPPFSLRLTFEERAKIEADAAGMSLGGYRRCKTARVISDTGLLNQMGHA